MPLSASDVYDASRQSNIVIDGTKQMNIPTNKIKNWIINPGCQIYVKYIYKPYIKIYNIWTLPGFEGKLW